MEDPGQLLSGKPHWMEGIQWFRGRFYSELERLHHTLKGVVGADMALVRHCKEGGRSS